MEPIIVSLIIFGCLLVGVIFIIWFGRYNHKRNERLWNYGAWYLWELAKKDGIIVSEPDCEKPELKEEERKWIEQRVHYDYLVKKIDDRFKRVHK